MAWIVRLVKIGAGGEEQATDVLKIDRPGVIDDGASLGLTSTEATLLMAGLRREIVAAQARDDAVWCPGMFRPPTSRQPRARSSTSVVVKKSPSTSPPEGDEDSVWGDLFGSMRGPAANPSPVAETPASTPPPDRTPTPKVRKRALGAQTQAIGCARRRSSGSPNGGTKTSASIPVTAARRTQIGIKPHRPAL
jgi:hypothetical protein